MSRAFIDYLRAKRALDDRSLSRDVADALGAHVRRAPPRRVIEIGAGIGTMLARAIDWDLLREAEYTALDVDADLIAEARRSMPTLARERGLACRQDADAFILQGGDRRVRVRLLQSDLFAFEGEGYDLLIAHQVLDLVDVPATLPRLWRWLRPHGAFWFSAIYDGATIFAPEHDPDLEAQILALYHRSMDDRVVDGRPSGDSRTGRRMFAHLPASGAEILAAGSSASVIHPAEGAYRDEDDVYLRHILDTFEAELGDHPELDAARFRAWLAARRGQIDRAELAYIIYQLDFFGRAPGAG